MPRVGSPALSPDGKWVVVSVIEPAYDEKDQVSDLWLVRVDGSSKPRRITFTKGAESGAAWSPDSTRIAFSAKRDGDTESQIYVLDLASGGEAARVTSIASGASDPKWSPDGTALLFTSRVKRIAEQSPRKYNARICESFPIRYWDRWLDDTSVHILIQPVQAPDKARDLLAGTKLAAEPGFGGILNALGGEDLEAAWATDGKSIVFAATQNRNAAAYANVKTDLYRVPVEGGEPARLTSGPASYSQPRFRPDGKVLFCKIEHGGDGKVYHLDRIAMLRWPAAGDPVVLTRNFDRSIADFALSPDGNTIYATAEEAGLERVFTLSVSGSGVTVLTKLDAGVYTGLRSAERGESTLLVAKWETATRPPEIVKIDPLSGSHQLLTTFASARAASLDLPALRHFWFTSKRGKKIHNMIALPPNFDENRKYPLFVLIHGGPASMWKDQWVTRWNYHLLAEPGYIVLLTNYTGSTGFGEKFAQEIQGDPLKGPGEEINGAVDEAIRRFSFIDGSRVAAGGASYGGHLANWLQATTTRYRCLISHAGLINLESQWGTSDTIYSRELTNGGPVWEQGRIWREQNPIRFAKNFRTPMLLTVGERDFRVPLNQTLENWSVLQRLRVPSRLIVFENENHWIQKGENSRFFYQEVKAWLAKYLGK